MQEKRIKEAVTEIVAIWSASLNHHNSEYIPMHTDERGFMQPGVTNTFASPQLISKAMHALREELLQKLTTQTKLVVDVEYIKKLKHYGFFKLRHPDAEMEITIGKNGSITVTAKGTFSRKATERIIYHRDEETKLDTMLQEEATEPVTFQKKKRFSR